MDAANNPSTYLTLLRDLGTPENQADAWTVFLRRYSPLLESWCPFAPRLRLLR